VLLQSKQDYEERSSMQQRSGDEASVHKAACGSSGGGSKHPASGDEARAKRIEARSR